MSAKLTAELAKICNGRGTDEVLQACMNIIMNCVKQNYGRRADAIARMNELYGWNMENLMEFYDPTTGHRRSVVPFNQVVSPSTMPSATRFPGPGGKVNGGS